MSYYGAGDYYGAGGLGGFLKGIGRGLVGFATGGVPGAIGAVASGRVSGGVPRGLALPRFGGGPPQITPPTGTALVGPVGRKRYRRMNYMNQKALRRANRRIDGAVKEMKKTLKHTNYKIVTKSSGRRGSRGVITAAEAKRALRS